jgi:hypothetical protein
MRSHCCMCVQLSMRLRCSPVAILPPPPHRSLVRRRAWCASCPTSPPRCLRRSWASCWTSRTTQTGTRCVRVGRVRASNAVWPAASTAHTLLHTPCPCNPARRTHTPTHPPTFQADSAAHEEDGNGELFDGGQEFLDRMAIALGGKALVPAAGARARGVCR